jgi:hypothetical protein
MRAWRGSSDGCGDGDGMVAGLDATGESMQHVGAERSETSHAPLPLGGEAG